MISVRLSGGRLGGLGVGGWWVVGGGAGVDQLLPLSGIIFLLCVCLSHQRISLPLTSLHLIHWEKI